MTGIRTGTYINPTLAQHPCYNGEAHGRYGRIHLPVSPYCNIRCRFCKRSRNKHEDRPGVARGILLPEQAVDVLERALALCPEITVVGIAGPGDTLASPHALETFRRVDAAYPHLVKCMSTNGLELFRHAQEIADVGVRTLTVTVNAVQADILERINGGIHQDGVFHDGKEGALRLLFAQMAGIRKVTDLGLTVKVNSVLVPGVNDHHIGEIARVTKSVGASLMNIIPLIPQHEFQDLQAPDCRMLNEAREAAEHHLPVFRHCRHCRADACGIPGGKDFASELYDKRLDTFSHG